MTSDRSTSDPRPDDPTAPTTPALRRILARAGGPELLDLLADDLSGADLTSLLLEVLRRRADRVTPADVMRRYLSDRFVAPAAVDFAALRRVEDSFVSALPDGFQMLVLAPVLPLAAHSAVATVDPRKVVATVRGTEVAADPTNALALEAAARRSRSLASDPHSAAPVRLAAGQRVVRAQRFQRAGLLAHFHIFGLVTAGRDTGSLSFEHEHLLEHLGFAARAVLALGAQHVEIRMTCLDPAFAPCLDRVGESLSGTPHVSVSEDPDRTSGRGYYTGLCYKVVATFADQHLDAGDGGFVDWTRQLIGNRKERLMISGFGMDRIATATTPPTSSGAGADAVVRP